MSAKLRRLWRRCAAKKRSTAAEAQAGVPSRARGEESTTRMGVVGKPSPKERRDLIHAAVNGKWTGTAPSSRLGLGVESGSKRKGSGAKPLDEIATRFPIPFLNSNANESV